LIYYLLFVVVIIIGSEGKGLRGGGKEEGRKNEKREENNAAIKYGLELKQTYRNNNEFAIVTLFTVLSNFALYIIIITIRRRSTKEKHT
jgi:hypothetical protein